jgi:hypothetical protein
MKIAKNVSSTALLETIQQELLFLATLLLTYENIVGMVLAVYCQFENKGEI